MRERGALGPLQRHHRVYGKARYCCSIKTRHMDGGLLQSAYLCLLDVFPSDVIIKCSQYYHCINITKYLGMYVYVYFM